MKKKSGPCWLASNEVRSDGARPPALIPPPTHTPLRNAFSWRGGPPACIQGGTLSASPSMSRVLDGWDGWGDGGVDKKRDRAGRAFAPSVAPPAQTSQWRLSQPGPHPPTTTTTSHSPDRCCMRWTYGAHCASRSAWVRGEPGIFRAAAGEPPGITGGCTGVECVGGVGWSVWGGEVV